MRQLGVIPNPENASPKDIEVAMEVAPNKRSYIRLGTLRALMPGTSRADVCKLYCRTDRMVRLWICMFNSGGIDALISRPKPGRPRKVSLQKLGDLLIPVLKHPPLAGERHWTGVKIHGWLKTQISEDPSCRSVIRSLHALDFHRRIPRPWPLPPEERAAEHEEKCAGFKEQLTAWAADPAVRHWFCDESGFEGDPRPRHRWVQPGSRPTVPYRGKHLRSNVIGAVAPADGALFTVVVSGVDTGVFQAFLDEMAATHPAQARVRQIIVLDNASWHKSKASTGTISSHSSCRPTVLTSTPSNASDCGSNATTSATTSPKPGPNSKSTFAQLCACSWMIRSKSPPTPLFGNDFWQLL